MINADKRLMKWSLDFVIRENRYLSSLIVRRLAYQLTSISLALGPSCAARVAG